MKKGTRNEGGGREEETPHPFSVVVDILYVYEPGKKMQLRL